MTPSPGELRWVRPPQQARSQETLDRLLDAAEALVTQKGFEDTPVSEIAQRAGSSVGAFYARFQDKDALLHALYERYYEQAIATADAALEPARWEDARIAEILEAVVRFLVSLYREQVGLIRAFVSRSHTDADFHARRERILHYVNDRLSALLLARRGEIGHPDAEKAAAFGLTLVFATLDSVMLFGDRRSGAFAQSDEEVAVELTRVYLAYLGATHIAD